MKDLAFSIGGTQINLPAQIQPLQSRADNFGSRIIANIISLLLIFAVLIALFYIVYGGIRWIMSSGDAKQIEGARNTILYAAIGLAVAFLSFAVVNVVAFFFGIPLL